MDEAKTPLNQNATVSLPFPQLGPPKGLGTHVTRLCHPEHILGFRYETHNQLDCGLC